MRCWALGGRLCLDARGGLRIKRTQATERRKKLARLSLLLHSCFGNNTVKERFWWKCKMTTRGESTERGMGKTPRQRDSARPVAWLRRRGATHPIHPARQAVGVRGGPRIQPHEALARRRPIRFGGAGGEGLAGVGDVVVGNERRGVADEGFQAGESQIVLGEGDSR